MSAPILPMFGAFLIFGLPYLVIYLQSRRLSAVEGELRRIGDVLASRLPAHRTQDNDHA